MSDPYTEAYRRRLDTFEPELWKRLDVVPSLPAERASKVLAYVLELACKTQNAANITLGRRALRQMPRSWLVEHLPLVASSTLDIGDEWEFRRFVEALALVDPELAEMTVERGKTSDNAGVRESAQDLAGTCATFAARHRDTLAEEQERP
jgi:hypothetical protein